MSFTFRVDAVQYEEPGDTVLVGFLKTGEIAGRELVCVPTRNGPVFQSSVIAMEVEGPMAMPLPASQGSRIQLVLKGCPAAKDVVVPCEAVSVPPQEPPARTSVERSDLLDSPLFWAMWYYLHVGTDDVDSSELMQPFFGVSNEAVNSFYLKTISKSEPDAPWVRIRIPVANGFSVAVEFAGEPYCEDRYILSHDSWESSVLLGYYSGHFALPALRWHEVRWIDWCVRKKAIGSDTHRRSSLLLMFPAVYLNSQDDVNEVLGV